MRHEKIKIDHLESEYPIKNSKWLNALADSMLDVGSAATPVIVAQLSLTQYRVMMYHQVYWAAKLAREKDPQFDKVEAVVVEMPQEWPAVESFLIAFSECG